MKKIVYILNALFICMLIASCGDKPPLESEPTLKVSISQSVNFQAAGGSMIVDVTTNQPSWSVVSNKDWCKITDKSDKKFTIISEANHSVTPRETATVTLQAGNANQVNISVNQAGAASTLSILPVTLNIEFNANSVEQFFEYAVTTNETSWDVQLSPDNALWCHVTKNLSNNTFRITTDVNSSGSVRNVKINVVAGNATPLIIMVNQKVKPSGDNKDFDYKEGTGWDK